MLSNEDKYKLFEVTNKCFEIIGPDDDEDGGSDKVDIIEETTVRLPSDKDRFEQNISIYHMSNGSTLPKKSTRGHNLKPFQK